MALPFKKSNAALLSTSEADAVVEAIRYAEGLTSGEVRVFIESHCKFVDAMDRAWEIFAQLEMAKTQERNAVLIYMAIKDRQIAIVGDEGIHTIVKKDDFWKAELAKLKDFCKRDFIADGLVAVIRNIGEKLAQYFPHREGEDQNEIPDEIVFGQ